MSESPVHPDPGSGTNRITAVGAPKLGLLLSFSTAISAKVSERQVVLTPSQKPSALASNPVLESQQLRFLQSRGKKSKGARPSIAATKKPSLDMTVTMGKEPMAQAITRLSDCHRPS